MVNFFPFIFKPLILLLLVSSTIFAEELIGEPEYDVVSQSMQFDRSGKHNGVLEKLSISSENLLKIFQVDIRNDEQFKKALDNSMDFYAGLLGSDAQFSYGDESYTPLQMLQSLRIFKELALRDQPFEDFLLDLNMLFDIYETKNSRQQSLLTGYYTPHIKASRLKSGEFGVPLFLAGNKKPNKAKADFYVKNLSDVHALALEGAGVLHFENGERLNIEYSGRVKIQYKKIVLKKQKKAVRYAKNRRANKRIVIVKTESKPAFLITNGGPFGSIDVPLTPRYTAAMDREMTPPGSLVYVKSDNSALATTVFADGQDEVAKGFESFMLVQDTGGAIKGGGRVDIYFGEGSEGRQNTYSISKTGSVFLIIAKKDILQDYARN